MVFVLALYLQIRRKSKESKEIDPLGRGKFAEMRRRSRWPSLIAYIIAASIGFQRVAVLTTGLILNDVVDDLRFHNFGIFFHVFSPHGADSHFQM